MLERLNRVTTHHILLGIGLVIACLGYLPGIWNILDETVNQQPPVYVFDQQVVVIGEYLAITGGLIALIGFLMFARNEFAKLGLK